jgi:hypothetical protein
MIIKKATRQVSKMRVGLFGPSGSGKTFSALRLAKGLTGDLSKVVVIDTENGSADLYSHLGEYSTLTLEAPFDPRRYIDAIKECEKAGFECIIIDSISHEWDGPGGCLEIHTKMGGKFETWAKVTPLHNSFISAIVQSSCHIIVTGRSKIDFAFEGKKDGGKGKVEKLGLKTVTREGFDYEMTLAFQINQEHLASIDKDRTNIFKDSIPFLISEETGEIIKKWNDGGVVKKTMDILTRKILEIISQLTDGYKDKEKLHAILREFTVSSSAEIQQLNDDQKEEILDVLVSKMRDEGMLS